MVSHVYGIGPFWVQQADVTISQANPVSTTIYSVLAVNVHVRILAISAYVAWAVTQPDPLEVIITTSSNSYIYTKTTPVTTTYYSACTIRGHVSEVQQVLDAAGSESRAFLFDDKSISVGVRVTWGVTQPTLLVCRVKWAKWM